MSYQKSEEEKSARKKLLDSLKNKKALGYIMDTLKQDKDHLGTGQ